MVLKFKTALARTTAFKLKIVYICSGLPFTSPGDLPDSGIEPRSPAMQADSLPSEPPGKPDGARNLAKYFLGEPGFGPPGTEFLGN